MTDQDILQHIQKQTLHVQVEHNPLNEFHMGKCLYACFPVLFPNGRGVANQVDWKDLFCHFFTMKDDRFRTNPRFYFSIII